jgi:predicted dehydrogenase
MSNGVLVSASFCHRTSDTHNIEVFGQRGRLTFSCYRADSLAVFSTSDLGGGVAMRLKSISQMVRKFPDLLKAGLRGGDYLYSFRAQWHAFIGNILRNNPLPCTFEDGRRALQVVLSAIESADRGQRVNIAETHSVSAIEHSFQEAKDHER